MCQHNIIAKPSWGLLYQGRSGSHREKHLIKDKSGGDLTEQSRFRCGAQGTLTTSKRFCSDKKNDMVETEALGKGRT